MKRILVFVACVVILIAVYWALSHDRFPPPDLDRTAGIRNTLSGGGQVTLVALGDSITAGSNAPFSYVRRVEETISSRFPQGRLRAINSGVSGDTAEGGLRRVERDVLSHDPDLVLVEFGWNDMKNGQSVERFEIALAGIVEEIRRGSSAVILLMTTTHVDVVGAAWKIKPFNKIIRRLAEERECGIVDLDAHFEAAREAGTTIEELMSHDRIHPSGKGQELIASAVLREILPAP